MPLKPGDTLLNGQYRIVRLIGRGGFGFVYLAEDTLLREQVAIKELFRALVGDEVMLKRFLAEAKATMRLSHNHIVRTHNVFREGDNYYIVMECMVGGSLEARLQEGSPLSVDEAVRIGAEVCEGLSYAHARGVVHCDLKPANILFSKDGEAKVSDFGIAHISGEMLTRTWQTPSGFAAGTLPYMSPEQADGVRDETRVDVYAIGAVLYRMLTGRTYLDFDQRETPGAQADNVLRIRDAQPKPPSTYDRTIPPWLDELVLKALAKQPEVRYVNVDELRSALAGEKPGEAPAPPSPQTHATPVPSPATPTVPPSSGLRRYWPMVLGGVALLVALLLGLLALVGSGGDGDGTTPPRATAPIVAQATRMAATSTLRPTAISVSSTPTPKATGTPAPLTSTPAPTNTSIPTPTDTATVTRSPTAPVAPTNTSRPTVTKTAMPTASVSAPAVPIATLRPPSTATRTAIPTKRPTVSIQFPPPRPVSPPDGQTFSQDEEVLLEWSPADKLPADGYYAVNLAFKHQGEIWHDDTPWLKEPRWAMSQHRYLLDLSDDGWYLWSVRVMQKTGEDAEGKFLGVPLSPTSAERALVWRQPEVGRGNGGGKPTLAPP